MDASAEETVSGSDEISAIDEGAQSTKKRGLDNQADTVTPPSKKSKNIGGSVSLEVTKPNSKVLVKSSTAPSDKADLVTKPRKDKSKFDKSGKSNSKSSTTDLESAKGLTEINNVPNKKDGPKARASADTVTKSTTSTSDKAAVDTKKSPSKPTKPTPITPLVANVPPESTNLKKPIETAKKDAGLSQRKKKNALKEKPGKGMGRGAKGSILGVV